MRLTEPIRIDGALDERVYPDVPPASGFIQGKPSEGEPATEQTEIWVTFDRTNLYIAGRCLDSAPEAQWIANEMRRDGEGQGECCASDPRLYSLAGIASIRRARALRSAWPPARAPA